ncbi:uncharacterized [Tachysurus ichikawai]
MKAPCCLATAISERKGAEVFPGLSKSSARVFPPLSISESNTCTKCVQIVDTMPVLKYSTVSLWIHGMVLGAVLPRSDVVLLCRKCGQYQLRPSVGL